MNRLIVIGASGHGKVVADIAVLNGYEDIVFLDDDESIKECAGFPVVGRTQDAKALEGDKIVAIGNAEIREKIQKEIVTNITKGLSTKFFLMCNNAGLKREYVLTYITRKTLYEIWKYMKEHNFTPKKGR